MDDPKVTSWTDTEGKVRTVTTRRGENQTETQWEDQHAAEVAAAKLRWPEAN